MSHRIAIHDDPRFLHVVVTGENSAQTVRAYLIEVISLCTARNAERLLIQENLSGPSLDSVEVFAVLNEAFLIRPPTVRCVAVVDVNPLHDPGVMRFVETIGVNRGLNVRAFASVPDAAEWLAGQPAEPAMGP